MGHFKDLPHETTSNRSLTRGSVCQFVTSLGVNSLGVWWKSGVFMRGVGSL